MQLFLFGRFYLFLFLFDGVVVKMEEIITCLCIFGQYPQGKNYCLGVRGENIDREIFVEKVKLFVWDPVIVTHPRAPRSFRPQSRT